MDRSARVLVTLTVDALVPSFTFENFFDKWSCQEDSCGDRKSALLSYAANGHTKVLMSFEVPESALAVPADYARLVAAVRKNAVQSAELLDGGNIEFALPDNIKLATLPFRSADRRMFLRLFQDALRPSVPHVIIEARDHRSFEHWAQDRFEVQMAYLQAKIAEALGVPREEWRHEKILTLITPVSRVAPHYLDAANIHNLKFETPLQEIPDIFVPDTGRYFFGNIYGVMAKAEPYRRALANTPAASVADCERALAN